MIKLEIRPDYAPIVAGILRPLELAWIELACYDASCRPPTSGGTGGSSKRGRGASSSEHLDLLFPGRREAGNKTVNEDGTFSVEGLNADGTFKEFKPATEKKIAGLWRNIGPDEDQYVANFQIAGKLAMGIDPITGKVDAAQSEIGLRESKWYSQAHKDCQDLSDSTGISMDAIVAATTTLSAGRLWSGTKNGNIETARNLAALVKNPIDVEITQAHLDMMDWRGAKSEKGVGRIGLVNHGLKPGKVSTADLDASTLVEVLYAMNTLRGHPTFKDWMTKTTKDGEPGAKSSPEQIKTPPPFPFFTSKGTQQVKQAVAVLRGEVTPRQAISGPKYSSFYSNIRNPDADYSSTNDTWHYRIMAGNLPLTHTRKGVSRTAPIDELSIAERSPEARAMSDAPPKLGKNGKPLKPKKAKGTTFATAQDIFQRGASSAPEGLDAGDGMFRDTTRMTRRALDQLKVDYPAQFGKMKIHEFQALIWVHYGGGQTSKTERLDRWDDARAKAREVGL